jgi:Spy/CpxP family protein refolding chaperone
MLSSRPRSAVRPVVLAALAALVLGLPVVAGAQTSTPAPAKAKSASTVAKRHAKRGAAEEQKEQSERLQQMTQRLKLTDDQVAKVKSIFEAQKVQATELRAKFKGQSTTPENKAAMEKAHKDLHADTEAKLAQVLTADQMTEY